MVKAGHTVPRKVGHGNFRNIFCLVSTVYMKCWSVEADSPNTVEVEEGIHLLRAAFISPKFGSSTISAPRPLFPDSGIPSSEIESQRSPTGVTNGTPIAHDTHEGRHNGSRSDRWSSGRKLCGSVRSAEGSARRLVPDDECGSPPPPLICRSRRQFVTFASRAAGSSTASGASSPSSVWAC